LSLDKKVGLGTESIKSSFRDLGLGTALFAAGAVGVVGAFALADKALAFEQAVATIAAVSGATATELAAAKEAALDAGIATQFSPTEATVGLKELAQAGFHATESTQLLLPVLDLAAGSLGELSPAQAAGLASQAMKAFGVSASDASVAVDRMLQAVNVFALNASELPQALGIASRGAQALHQNLSETLVALGLVKNVIPGVERASAGVARPRAAAPSSSGSTPSRSRPASSTSLSTCPASRRWRRARRFVAACNGARAAERRASPLLVRVRPGHLGQRPGLPARAL
jgi:hypothetical protein